MPYYVERLPESVRKHIRLVRGTAGLPRSDNTEDLLAQGWLEKKEKFEKTVRRKEMQEVTSLPRDDPRGCLALTISGSLLSISPLRDSFRTTQYASIRLRGNVPGVITSIAARLEGDVVVGQPVSFEKGPIRITSPVHRMAVTSEDLDLEAQLTLITQATRYLNRQLIEGMRELEMDGG